MDGETTVIGSRQFSRRRIAQGAAGAAALAALRPTEAAFARATRTAQEAGANEVRMLIRKPTTLNPLFSTSGNEQQIERAIFGALVKLDNRLTPTPDLAESFEASPDGLTYTFRLHDGLMFSDGQPLTARDVAFTIERAVDKRVGSIWRGRFLAIAGAEAYGDQAADTISGLQMPDERTVVISLLQPDATFLLTLGDYTGFCILPQHVLQEVAPDQLANETFLDEPVVGAGPFEFVRYEVDQFIELRRNERYPVKRPALDRVLLPIRTPEVALGEMETGDLDIMRLPLAEVERVESMEGVELESVPSPSMDVIGINLQRPYLQDKRVRQAMMHAIDRATIVESLLKGRGEVVNSPIFGPEWMGMPEGLNAYEYDPERAKALLQEAGWDANQPVDAMTVPPNEEWWAEIVQQQLREVGIQFNLRQVEVSELIDKVFADEPDFDCFLSGGDTYRADPNISSLFYGSSQFPPAGGNASRYANPTLDELYTQGRATNDLAERKRIYTEAAKLLNEDVPTIFLWSPNSFFAVNLRVEGFMGPGYVDNRLWNVEDWSVTG